MADEFLESEIVFSDQLQLQDRDQTYFPHRRDPRSSKKKTGAGRKMVGSVPVSIPGNICRFVGFHGGEEDEMEFDDGEMTPPHLIVGRRIAGKMAFSVCTGNGRTLKGRDLSQVRNSILRLTGFLET